MIGGTGYQGGLGSGAVGAQSSGNPPAVTTAKSTGHGPTGAGYGVQYSTQVVTGANIGTSAITPPATGMYLVNIRILSGVGPGVLKIQYAPPALACFPYANLSTVAASGVSWNSVVQDYPVNWYLGGVSIAAANFSIVGKNPTEVEFTFCTQPGPGPAIANYRGSTGATLTSSAASTVTNTVTFEYSPAHAKSILFLVGWGSGTLTGTPDAFVAMPAVGPFTQGIYGGNVWATQNGAFPGTPVGIQGDAPTLVLNMTTTSLGGATTLETIPVVYY